MAKKGKASGPSTSGLESNVRTPRTPKAKGFGSGNPKTSKKG